MTRRPLRSAAWRSAPPADPVTASQIRRISTPRPAIRPPLFNRQAAHPHTYFTGYRPFKQQALRAYVYAYLNSPEAQNQMLRNEYGAIQQHLEPHHVADLLIPIPDDWSKVADVVKAAKAYIKLRESSDGRSLAVEDAWTKAIGPLMLGEE